MANAVRYLAALGHRRIGRVGGACRIFVQTAKPHHGVPSDDRASLASCRSSPPLTSGPKRGPTSLGDLLVGPERPTAFIYESDMLAVAGLGVAHEMGLHVPRDVSIVAWDDSPFCQVVHPPLSVCDQGRPGSGRPGMSGGSWSSLTTGICGDLELPYGSLHPAWQHRPGPVQRRPRSAEHAAD